jgi:ABC-type transport system involved in cytochrome bd biosynthesis fused ATPase/permease subunit
MTSIEHEIQKMKEGEISQFLKDTGKNQEQYIDEIKESGEEYISQYEAKIYYMIVKRLVIMCIVAFVLFAAIFIFIVLSLQGYR